MKVDDPQRFVPRTLGLGGWVISVELDRNIVCVQVPHTIHSFFLFPSSLFFASFMSLLTVGLLLLLPFDQKYGTLNTTNDSPRVEVPLIHI
jgi:hypothetical protein